MAAIASIPRTYWGNGKVWYVMRRERRKILIGMMLGALLIVGGGFLCVQEADRGMAEAEAWAGQPPQRVKVDPEKAAQHIADAFQVDEGEVRAAIEEKRDFRDIGHAAMVAKICGKSFDEIFAQRESGKTWREVEDAFGVTQVQVKSVMEEMEARHLAERGVVTQQKALSLLRDGYRSFDVFEAGVLATASGEEIQSVLDRKKINNQWVDVAKQLGLDESVLSKRRDVAFEFLPCGAAVGREQDALMPPPSQDVSP